jgi:hydrogenase expression/formation protein HypC
MNIDVGGPGCDKSDPYTLATLNPPLHLNREPECTGLIYHTLQKGESIMCLGIPGQVLEIVDDDNSIAKVIVSGVKRNVSVALVRPEGIGPGDWVLIHVGFAMSKIDENEAQETMKALYTMGNIFTDELQMLHESQIE